MKITVSTDEHSPLVDAVIEEIQKRGHEVEYFGPRVGEPASEAHDWPLVTVEAVSRVADGQADQAVVMCWTGTGASLAANKVDGIRAALCHDAETAKGARVWNHANVLALSLRATPVPIAREIIEAWFSTPCSDDEWNLRQMRRIRELEKR
ncbi:MAG TPA: RpiB/LacA/LacB family sugar-phosphate isomerase [Anaerolineae bacterium]|nr:RpiB/LacA/LacB family sugar-phosphate isomerase [Anaerolineae bacterium]